MLPESLVENLVVDFPGGKVDLKWWDWVLGGAVLGGLTFGAYKLSKGLNRVDVSRGRVLIDFKKDSDEEPDAGN